jgi:hypothetical protein
MSRLRIAIDPAVKERYGPEICWVWRLLLTDIGLPWEEVPVEHPQCDVAYVTDARRSCRSRIRISADLERWECLGQQRLSAVAGSNGCWHPVFQGEAHTASPFAVAAGQVTCDRDIIFDLFWLTTGQAERHFPKSTHGHYDLTGTVVHRERVLQRAPGSSIRSGLAEALVAIGGPRPRARWPQGKRAAACFTHDVDYPHAIRLLEPLRILHRQGLRGLAAIAAVVSGRRTHWHFSSWLELERALGVQPAFYFVATQGSLLKWAAGTRDPFYDVRSPEFRDLFAYLQDEGVEVGLHASYRASEDRARFATEKQVLEAASGQPVRGNRHHYWRLNPDDPESTLLLHEQVGLTYDTSVAHERYVGWRRGWSAPYFPFHQQQRRELKTLQIPTTWMDDQLFGHRADNPGERLEILGELAARAAAQGGCLCVDVHSHVFDDVLFPEWAATYRGLLEHLAARNDFWVDTPAHVAQHWIDRHASVVRASHGLTGA